MGVRNNDVLSGINAASKNGTYTPQQQTAPAPQQPTGRPRSDTAFSSPAALGLGAPAQPAGRARSDTTFSSPAALGLDAPAQPAGQASSVQATSASAPAAAPAAQASISQGSPVHPALLALMNETPEDENKDLANMRILEPTEDDRGSIQFASPKKHWWQRLRKK